MAESTTTTAVASSALPIDVQDEISWTIYEFRRQRSPIQLIKRNNRGGPVFHAKKGKQTLHQGCFSDVRYCAAQKRKRDSNLSCYGNEEENLNSSYLTSPSIEVSYLFDKVLSLKIRVYIRTLNPIDKGDDDHLRDEQGAISETKSFYTTFVTLVDSDDYAIHSVSREKWNILRGRLRSICDSLNNKKQEKAKPSSSSSIFAILSKLLLSLNELQTECQHAQSIDRSQVDKAQKSSNCSLTDRERSIHLEGLLGQGRSSSTITKSLCPGGVDLAIILLRCAALGKHRDIFCHPFPRTREGSLADRVWNATESYQRFQRRRIARQQRLEGGSNNTKDGALSKVSMPLHSSEHELLGFLCSLPWMNRGWITVTRPQGPSGNEEYVQECQGLRFKVCLHLDGNDDGSNSDISHCPRFVRSCHDQGELIVYHGTHMENVWSILNNGLFNPSGIGKGGTEFVKNGAVLGSGIYLSTKISVANRFAWLNAKTQKIRTALMHDCTKSLLSMAPGSSELGINPGIRELGKDNVDSKRVSFEERYDISCFPVFEARIPHPPEEGKHSSDDRLEGAVCVVRDERDVRITKLHVTFELKRKNRGEFIFWNFISSLKTSFSTSISFLGFMGIAISFALLKYGEYMPLEVSKTLVVLVVLFASSFVIRYSLKRQWA